MSIIEQTDSDETDNEIHQIDNCDITSSSIDISSDKKKLNSAIVIILIIVIVKEN